MARKICNHPVFPSLRTKLTAYKITVCPTCLIRLHIFEIAETQAGMESRGGVFASKATAIANAVKPRRGQEWDYHRTLMKRWRTAKINVYRDLCLLETLRVEGAKKTRWELQLSKAFELWEEVAIECGRIPGYKYTVMKEADDSASEGTWDVEQDADFECRLNEDMIYETDVADDGRWRTVKPKARIFKRSPDDTMLSKPLGTKTKEDTHANNNAYNSTKLEVLDSDEAVLQEKEGVTSRIERSSYWDGRNRYDLLREIGDEDDNGYFDTPEISISTPSSSRPPETDSVATVSPPVPLATSSLKRKRSCHDPHNLQSQKMVHMADTVTIICDDHAHNTTGLSPKQDFYKRAHFSYTTAEAARRRLSFYRRSPLYVPSTWALSEEYENVNTSHYKTPWDIYDAIQRLELVKETKEALAEGKLRFEDDRVSDKVGELDENGYDRYYSTTVLTVQPCIAFTEKQFSEPQSEP